MRPHASARVRTQHGGEDGDPMHGRGATNRMQHSAHLRCRAGGAADCMQHNGEKMETVAQTPEHTAATGPSMAGPCAAPITRPTWPWLLRSRPEPCLERGGCCEPGDGGTRGRGLSPVRDRGDR